MGVEFLVIWGMVALVWIAIWINGEASAHLSRELEARVRKSTEALDATLSTSRGNQQAL